MACKLMRVKRAHKLCELLRAYGAQTEMTPHMFLCMIEKAQAGVGWVTTCKVAMGLGRERVAQRR